MFSLSEASFPMRFMDLMKPLVHFFRPAPQSRPTLDTQVAALDEGSPELIAATALSGEEGLRAAAVRKLPDGPILRRLAGLSEGAAPTASASLERIAQERVAQLIDSGSIDFAALRASVRHTTAMRLLHAGVDTSVIALWLGHVSVETTQIYLHADLKLKEQALSHSA
jgi:hypothetical protein